MHLMALIHKPMLLKGTLNDSGSPLAAEARP
jgi:hypothetical protein